MTNLEEWHFHPHWPKLRREVLLIKQAHVITGQRGNTYGRRSISPRSSDKVHILGSDREAGVMVIVLRRYSGGIRHISYMLLSRFQLGYLVLGRGRRRLVGFEAEHLAASNVVDTEQVVHICVLIETPKSHM